MRDWLIAGLICGSLPFCMLQPRVGVYVWYVVGLLNPHRLAWGFAYQLSPALYVAVATLSGLALGRARFILPRRPEVYLLGILALLFSISTVVALFPGLAWTKWQQVMKILLMTFVTMGLVREEAHLRILLRIVAASIGFWAVKAIPWAIATGGQYHLQGPDQSFIGSNNDIGLALNMALPIMLLLAQTEKDRRLRLAFYVTFYASILGVILTYSRGALVGLVAVVLMLVFRSKKPFVTILLVGATLATFLSLVPTKWFERMNTIGAYQEDNSAMSRIQTWTFATELGVARPFTGGGFEAFRANPTDFDAHSVYFGLIGEQGFIALGVFLLLVAVTWRHLDRIRGQARRTPALDWHGRCAGMLQVSMFGYLANGLTLNHQYFDLFYLIIALATILWVVCVAHLNAVQAAAAAVPAGDEPGARATA